VITRLACWSALVAGIAALGYAAYGSSASQNGQEIYSYTDFADGTIQYAIILGVVLLIAIDRWDLLSFRRPRSLGRAAALALGIVLAILVWEGIVTLLPIESPGKEQGLTPTHWEAAHAGAFAANVVLFTVIAPLVEEITFRGVGFSLLRRFGAVPAIGIIGIAFGLWHGLLVALLVLIPFGWGLAYLRERTNSIYPCIVVHALFNAAAIVASVAT
jgi:membrane protease YdiL (CAAX protease family)